MQTKSIAIVENGNLSNSGRITAAMLDRHAKAGLLSITKDNSTYYLNIGNRSIYLYGYYNDFNSSHAWTCTNENHYTFADFIDGDTEKPISEITCSGWDYEIVAHNFGCAPTHAAGQIMAVLAKKCREAFGADEASVNPESFAITTK